MAHELTFALCEDKNTGMITRKEQLYKCRNNEDNGQPFALQCRWLIMVLVAYVDEDV